MGTPCCLTPFGSTLLYYLGQQREHQKENTQEPLPLGYCHPVRVLATYAGDHVGYAAAETSFWSLSLRCSQESHMHIPVRGEEKAGRLALGACQAPWPPAHITPLFHVQAVQDTASSQAEAIIFTLQKHLLLERQNAGQSGEKA